MPEPAPTVAGLLLARRDDPRPALLFEDQTSSWAELVAGATARARVALDRRRPGPFHVGVLLDNVPEYVLWLGAAALSGATVVGINPTRRGAELVADVTHTDCQLLITDHEHAPALQVVTTGLGPARTLLVDDPADAAEVASATGNDAAVAETDPEAPLLLMFTSGSTGRPKAVICSQARLGAIAARTPEQFGITADTVCYQSMPLFHGNAIMANLAPVLGAGATVALRRRFTASGFLADVRRFDASYFNYVGRSLAYVLATPEQPDDADNPLRLGFGTEASARDIEAFQRRYGCAIRESYGSSEGAIAITKVPGTPPASLGRPHDDTDVAIVDPDTGRECPPARFDEHGALLNGHQAIGEFVGRHRAGSFEGYYANPEAEAERVRGDDFWTGDLGYRDAQGWYYFAGRSADRLRVDSENFSAAPVERILARFPDATMVAVYPVPDPRTGDQVMVAVELAPGTAFDPDRFRAFLDAQPDLGTKWAPRFVRVVAEMPLTGTNKVDKAPLRAEAWRTTDPVWWVPERAGGYRPFASDDCTALDAELDTHGRAAALARR